MKAEGSAKDPDAQLAQANCLEAGDQDVGLLELVTPEVCNSLVCDQIKRALLLSHFHVC